MTASHSKTVRNMSSRLKITMIKRQRRSRVQVTSVLHRAIGFREVLSQFCRPQYMSSSLEFISPYIIANAFKRNWVIIICMPSGEKSIERMEALYVDNLVWAVRPYSSCQR